MAEILMEAKMMEDFLLFSIDGGKTDGKTKLMEEKLMEDQIHQISLHQFAHPSDLWTNFMEFIR